MKALILLGGNAEAVLLIEGEMDTWLGQIIRIYL